MVVLGKGHVPATFLESKYSPLKEVFSSPSNLRVLCYMRSVYLDLNDELISFSSAKARSKG